MSYQNDAVSKAIDYIIKKIQNGEWAEGERIWTENMLCSELKVSRVALREAMSLLCEKHIIKKVKGSGSFVCPASERTLEGQQMFYISDNDVFRLGDLRILLGRKSVQLFIQNASQNEIDELEQNYYEMLKYRNETDKFNKLANQFHMLISKGSQNPFIYRIELFLGSYMNVNQQMIASLTGDKVAIQYHYKILQAIKESNITMATAYMQYHIELGLKFFGDSLKLQKKQGNEEDCDSKKSK